MQKHTNSNGENMKALRKHIDVGLFKELVPLKQLSEAAHARFALLARMESRNSGEVIFQKGDTAQVTVYLLEGEVTLNSPLSPEERIRAHSETACYPLAHHFPRHVTVRAVSRVKLLVIDGDVGTLIDSLMSEPGKWKTDWLKSPLLARLSHRHLDDLFDRMQEITVQAGQTIIHQDETADCYYVIKQGRCSVSRRPAPRARDVKLAELTAGHGFGEEALITNATRNASITMMEDGVLLRLSKDDFIASLAKPLLQHMSYEELLSHRHAVLVDVRTPEEFETDGLIGSLNMPMPVLRLKAHRLDPQRVYVVYSNTGHFSTAAAFILLQQGLDAYVLKGGLNEVPSHRVKNAASRQDGKVNNTPHSIVNFPHVPRGGELAADQKTAVKFDWVSDEAMWRNTIGLRDDRELESLFTPSDMYQGQAVDTSRQGFEDVRLFTKVGAGSGARLSLEDDGSAASTHNCSAHSHAGANQRMDSTFGPHAMYQSNASHAQHYAEPSRHRILGRTGTFALAMLMLTIGFAAAYWTNDSLRDQVGKIPEWLQKQRDLDAKVSRLLENIERLPAMRSAVAPHVETAPSTIRNSESDRVP